MKHFTIFFLLSALMVGGVSATSAQTSTSVQPDNTGVNARDQNSRALTAGQQSNAKSDVELTRRIRRALTSDHSMSTLARNVKIVSTNGRVTLRGPVNTKTEKATIASKAEAIAGAENVDNELEIKSRE